MTELNQKPSIINAHNVCSFRTIEFIRLQKEIQPKTAEFAEKTYEAWASVAPLQTKELPYWSPKLFQASIGLRNQAIFIKETLDTAIEQGLLPQKVISQIKAVMEFARPPQISIWGWIGSHESYNSLMFQSKRQSIIRQAQNYAETRNSSKTKTSGIKPRM